MDLHMFSCRSWWQRKAIKVICETVLQSSYWILLRRERPHLEGGTAFKVTSVNNLDSSPLQVKNALQVNTWPNLIILAVITLFLT